MPSEMYLTNQPNSGKLFVDPSSRLCTVARADHRVRIALSNIEFNLLETLYRNKGNCLSRDRLLDEVWGINFETGTNTVDVAICGLRKKLKSAGLDNAVVTVRGIGYRLDLMEPQ